MCDGSITGAYFADAWTVSLNCCYLNFYCPFLALPGGYTDYIPEILQIALVRLPSERAYLIIALWPQISAVP